MLLYVFCLDPRPVGTREVDAFISEGAYFQLGAQIATAQPTMASDGAEWDEKSIFYQAQKRPVVLRCERRPCALAREVPEVIDALGRAGAGPRHDVLIGRLNATRQLFVLDINPAGASDECWEMVDNLQSWIARQRGGLIYVPGEGCYDADLQSVFKL